MLRVRGFRIDPYVMERGGGGSAFWGAFPGVRKALANLAALAIPHPSSHCRGLSA